jgi:Guanylate-binding protein, N-terminal domain
VIKLGLDPAGPLIGQNLCGCFMEVPVRNHFQRFSRRSNFIYKSNTEKFFDQNSFSHKLSAIDNLGAVRMATNSHTHPHGRPINILKFGEGKKIIVENAELDKMFLHPDVKNRKVVVVSIIGAFRRGKSFFLDYCLRFLYSNVSD